MKKYIIMLLIITWGIASFAQTNTTPSKKKNHNKNKKKAEQVVVNSTGHNTVVEIKNDKIYVDGEVVSSIKNAKSEDHKIVIKHGGKGHKKPKETDIPEHRNENKEPEHSSSGNTNGIAIIEERNWPMEGEQQKEEVNNNTHNALLGVYTNTNIPADGAYITGVIPNSAADRAGLAPGDIITKVNETTVNSGNELKATIATYDAGEHVIIYYNRDGSMMRTFVSLGDKYDMGSQREQQPMQESWQNNYGNRENRNDIMEHNNGYNQYETYRRPVRLGISASDGRRPRGAYLDEVKPGSPAQAAGLQKGDIITRIDGERIWNALDMQELMSMPGIGNDMIIDYRHDGIRMRTEVHTNSNSHTQDYRSPEMNNENDRRNGYEH